MESGQVIREVSAQVMRLAPLDPDNLTDQQLIDSVAAMVTANAVIDGMLARLLAHTDLRGLAQALGASSTAAWLSDSGRLDPGPANRAVNTAKALDALPTTAAALRTGDISADHATAIAAAMDALDIGCPTLDAADRRAAEETLTTLALTATPAVVAKRGHELLLALAPPELDDTTREDASRNRLTISTKRNGRTALSGDFDVETAEKLHTALSGDFDVETAEKLHTALSGLTKPRPADDDTPDPRSPARRRADGFTDILDAYLRHGTGPAEGGIRPHLTLTATARDLARNGHCDGCTCSVHNRKVQLAWMGPFSTEAARLLACDSDLTTILLDDSEVPLNLGRTQRLVTPGLRKALIIRDHGCAMPGCGRPAAWCHAHHIRHWIDGGPTDLANMVLLCGHHHRVIHQQHWHVYIGDDGHPWFTPPERIDKHRRPLPAHNRSARSKAAA